MNLSLSSRGQVTVVDFDIGRIAPDIRSFEVRNVFKQTMRGLEIELDMVAHISTTRASPCFALWE